MRDIKKNSNEPVHLNSCKQISLEIDTHTHTYHVACCSSWVWACSLFFPPTAWSSPQTLTSPKAAQPRLPTNLTTTGNWGDELPLKVMKGDEEANGPDTSNLLLRHQPFLTGTNAIPPANAIKKAGKTSRTYRFITWHAKPPAAMLQKEWNRGRESHLAQQQQRTPEGWREAGEKERCSKNGHHSQENVR